jgi:hypothetical protein
MINSLVTQSPKVPRDVISAEDRYLPCKSIYQSISGRTMYGEKCGRTRETGGEEGVDAMQKQQLKAVTAVRKGAGATDTQREREKKEIVPSTRLQFVADSGKAGAVELQVNRAFPTRPLFFLF